MSFLQTSKKIIFLDWDFFNHLAPDMQYERNELFCILNCPTIHIHFFMKYKLNGRHTFLSNLWTFSVPYLLVVLIFFGEKIYSTCFSLQISTWLIKQIIKWFHKNSFLCEGSHIAYWRKHWMSRNKLLKPEISPFKWKNFVLTLKYCWLHFCCKG